MNRLCSLAVTGLILLAVAPTSHAASLAIPVAADTYIRNDGGGPNSKNDADPDNEIIIGTNSAATARLNGLLRFDVSPLAAASAGATLQINSVSLEMRTRTGANGAGATLTLDVMDYAFEFVEADATYNDPDGDGSAATGDTTPGGTFGTVLSSLTFNPTPQDTPHTFGSTQAFIDAVANAVATDGTLNLLLAESAPNGNQQFARFNDEDRLPPPTLVIDFQVVPEPGSLVVWLVAGLAMVGLVVRRWRRR